MLQLEDNWGNLNINCMLNDIGLMLIFKAVIMVKCLCRKVSYFKA